MRAGNHIKTKHAAALSATHTVTHTERVRPTQEQHRAGNHSVFNPDVLQLLSDQQEISFITTSVQTRSCKHQYHRYVIMIK